MFSPADSISDALSGLRLVSLSDVPSGDGFYTAVLEIALPGSGDSCYLLEAESILRSQQAREFLENILRNRGFRFPVYDAQDFCYLDYNEQGQPVCRRNLKVRPE